MLDLSANRPCSSKHQSLPALDLPATDLLINIKARGKWACFAATSHHSTCLLRTGVLEFAGPAHLWPRCIPRGSDTMVKPPVLVERHAIAAPVGSYGAAYGMMFIDYDACRAHAIEDLGSGFCVDARTAGMKAGGSVEYDWIHALLAADRLPVVEVELGQGPASLLRRAPLPAPPPGLRNIAAWMTAAAAQELGVPEHRVAQSNWVAPLQVPGWNFFHAYANSQAAVDFFSDNIAAFHPRELEIWADWAQSYDYRILAKAARDLAAAASTVRDLDQSLPQVPPAAPARHRM